MSHSMPSAETETDPIDHAALRLMLSYVEAECLRIGATDAARHAALAAALMPVPRATSASAEAPRRGRRTGSSGSRLRIRALH
jgi:hypothetical protein